MNFPRLCGFFAATRFPSLRFALALGLAIAAVNSAASPESPKATTIDGVLIDSHCSSNAETRVVSDSGIPHLAGGILWAYTHTRRCALMTECQRSGYGLATHDSRFLKFDAEGSRKALAMLKATTREDDLEVVVTGAIDGDQMHVQSIEWRKGS
jgi:hypothetical protein